MNREKWKLLLKEQGEYPVNHFWVPNNLLEKWKDPPYLPTPLEKTEIESKKYLWILNVIYWTNNHKTNPGFS